MDEKYTPHLSITKTSITNYAYSGKIMLISVIVLFVFCLSFAAFHFYSSSVLLRRSRNLLRHRLHHRRSSFTSDSPDSPLSATTKGLSSSVVNALSTFVYSASRKVASPLVCAVCLSEFKKNETGRVLPKCNHGFHIECIDMWFLSHSTCPLCRAPVQLSPGPSHNQAETIINVVGHDLVDSELGPNYRCNRMVQSSSYSHLPQLLESGSEDIGPITARKLTGPEQMCGPVKTLTRFLSI